MSQFDNLNGTQEALACIHLLSDHEEVVTRVEIKDFENRQMTVIYRYRCHLHPGKSGTYKIVIEI